MVTENFEAHLYVIKLEKLHKYNIPTYDQIPWEIFEKLCICHNVRLKKLTLLSVLQVFYITLKTYLQEYLQPLEDLQFNMKNRMEVGAVLRELRLSNIQCKFEAEQMATEQNFQVRSSVVMYIKVFN